MKIERISDNKIRVTISLDDLEERNIDLESLNYDTPAAQELFRDMMEQAELEFGFSAEENDSHLVFEAYQNSDDCFVVTITRLDDESDFESIHKYIKNKYRNHDLRTGRRSRKLYSSLLIYRFKDFDDLCSAVKATSGMYTGESSLYEYKGCYYLVLSRNNLNITRPRAFDAIIREYGEKLSNQSFYDGFLNEYGNLIVEGNAMEVIDLHF